MKNFTNKLRTYNNDKFIPSYTFLNKSFPPMETKLIELILSFEDKGNEFYMNHKMIGELLNITPRYVKKLVKTLKDVGCLSTVVTPNIKVDDNKVSFGGRKSNIKINEDNIIRICEGKSPILELDQQEVKKEVMTPQKVDAVNKPVITANNAEIEITPPVADKKEITPKEQPKESLEEFKKTLESYKPDVNPLKKYISDNADSIIKGYSFVDLNAMVRDGEIKTMEELLLYFEIEEDKPIDPLDCTDDEVIGLIDNYNENKNK